ncbi:MAG: adenosylcobinamide-phosphate synthase CbiB [Oscillospiraceae bacterium]|nr:adenosylcobinamide-phosphate synthase CbiB [Oscillospiraceae bacterium]
MAEYIAIIIIVAFVLDCFIGDPQNPLHPIRLIGGSIAWGMGIYKKAHIKSPTRQFVSGTILAIMIICLTYIATRLITWGFYSINWWIGLIVEAILCYFIIAAKSLKVESMKVYHALVSGDLHGARNNLARIVGRDTQSLDEQGIVKATVETVAENLSDGVIAPLIFIFIGGAPLAMAYKAVNTLDSMIGYRNEDFEYFGKFAARLDDVVNFIPARISALFMIIGSAFVGGHVKGAVRIYLRDRRNHNSPNSAQTESVCAGALGLCLGGDSYYHGVLVHKPTIGDAENAPLPEHIKAANRLMYATATVTVVVLVAISFFLRGFVYV